MNRVLKYLLPSVKKLYGQEYYSDEEILNVDFADAKLKLQNFRGGDLEKADLTGANLQVANLYEADLRGAQLTPADLSYANFQRADFTGANFSEAKGLPCCEHCSKKETKSE